MPVFLRGIGLAQQHMGLEPGAVSLAAFHTAFIALGVVIFLPFTRQFARWIERLLPEQGPHLIRHLDDTLLAAPPVALEASRRTLTSTALELIDLAQPMLNNATAAVDPGRNFEAGTALSQTQQFFARIPTLADDEPLSRQRITQLHAIDHLMRLHARLSLSTETRKALVQPALEQATSQCRKALNLAVKSLRGEPPPEWEVTLERYAQAIAELHRDERLNILQQTASGRRSPPEAMATLDAIRWLERVSYHVWRVCYYLLQSSDPPASNDSERVGDI